MADLSQRDLAELIGWHPAYVGSVERGRIAPKPADAARIAEAVGYPGMESVVFDADADHPRHRTTGAAFVPSAAIAVLAPAVLKELELDPSVYVALYVGYVIVLGTPRVPGGNPLVMFERDSQEGRALESVVKSHATWHVELP